jgi:alkanesulfonate monooxygenase SsuD/methylene tetrahydromethanopterin reductase-like flavin-dependent oxidoreductase (luciferase family)
VPGSLDIEALANIAFVIGLEQHAFRTDAVDYLDGVDEAGRIARPLLYDPPPPLPGTDAHVGRRSHLAPVAGRGLQGLTFQRVPTSVGTAVDVAHRLEASHAAGVADGSDVMVTPHLCGLAMVVDRVKPVCDERNSNSGSRPVHLVASQTGPMVLPPGEARRPSDQESPVKRCEDASRMGPPRI